MTDPFSHGFIPVRRFGDLIVPNRTKSVLAGELGVDASCGLVVEFAYLENGRAFAHMFPIDADVEFDDRVKFAIPYLSLSSMKKLVDEKVGVLRTWDDIEAAAELLPELPRWRKP